MALHIHLPIYKVAYDLVGVAVDYTCNMPRDVKHVIGSRVRDLSLDVVLMILRANCTTDKAPYLTALLEQVSELELLLRLCMDKRFISKPQYAKAVELTTSVGKQANAWRKHNAASPVT